MKINDVLLELNSGVMGYFKQQFPNTPDYVIKDFIYKNYKANPRDIEPEIVEWLNELTWTKKKITVTIDIFDDFTQSRLTQLIGDPGQTQDDRFKTQQRLIDKLGAVREPIILTQDGDVYELQEGWHRTVEALKRWPEGYEQIAYIGN